MVVVLVMGVGVGVWGWLLGGPPVQKQPPRPTLEPGGGGGQ